MNAMEFIREKRDGRTHASSDIEWFVRALVRGEIADEQVGAWLMAAYLNGLSPDETFALTLAMRDSGEALELNDSAGITLDKHSTGGVGDKTTLIVVPILASLGVPILKMSGRGLGFSGGTLDKLEAIPGFRTDLSASEALSQVEQIGAAIVGQSKSLAPADKLLYAMRDVTATVDSIPLIAASIMSKKLAGGASSILLDVKVGRGSFMKDLDRATELANTLVAIGKRAGKAVRAVLTRMDEPLGRAVGNALEVREAIEFLTPGGHRAPALWEVCRTLCIHGLAMSRPRLSPEAASDAVDNALESGEALAKFVEIVEAQGGEADSILDPLLLPKSPILATVASPRSGYVSGINARRVGELAMWLGAGRVRKEDCIHPGAGIVLLASVGDVMRVGGPLAELHVRTDADFPEAEVSLLGAFSWSDEPPDRQEMILAEVG